MRTWLALATLGLLTAGTRPSAGAQDPPSPELPPPFSLTYVDGRADVARADGVDPAQAPDVLDAGDRLLVAAGRAELVSADGSLVACRSRRRPAHRRRRPAAPRAWPDRRPHGGVRDAARPGDSGGRRRSGAARRVLITARDLDADVTIAALTRPSVSGAAHDRRADRRQRPRWPSTRRGLEPRWSRAADGRDAFTDWAERRVADMQQSRETQPLPVELTAYAPDFATYGALGHAARIRLGVVPGDRTWLASLRQRFLAAHTPWLDVDRPRPLGLAGASLRALGTARVAWLVLDAAACVGAGVGRLGTRSRLRRLGAARLGLAAGGRLLRRRARRPRRPLGKQLVGGAAPRLRPPRSGRSVLHRPAPLAGTRARRIRLAGAPATGPRRMGSPRPAGARLRPAGARRARARESMQARRAGSHGPAPMASSGLTRVRAPRLMRPHRRVLTPRLRARRDAAADPRQRRGPAAPADAPTSTWREPVAVGRQPRASSAPRPGDAGPDRDASPGAQPRARRRAASR